MKRQILADFQICISVPLIGELAKAPSVCKTYIHHVINRKAISYVQAFINTHCKWQKAEESRTKT